MAELKIGRLVLGVAQANCYFVYRNTDDMRKNAIIIDPADRGEYIFDTLVKNGIQPAGVLLTHGHFDHILGLEGLQQNTDLKTYAWEREQELCESVSLNITASMGRAYVPRVDEYLKDGDVITIADMSCRLIATPGHTGGSCCYYFEEAEWLLSGDTLFQESVGRTDFPTGSMSELVRSIREKLLVLPEEVKVYPGHGDSTSIGYEKRNNPFL